MSKQISERGSRAGSLPLVGGILALDFCNTASGRGTDGFIEHLRTASHLLTWARHAGILDEPVEAQLRSLCDLDRALTSRLLTRAWDMRSAIYNLDAALARGEVAAQADMDMIAGAYAVCLAKGRLTTREGAFGWSWRVEQAPEEVVLGPIAASAMALITVADRARLKQCEGHNCGWLFLDTTKNNNRRWCEMEPCGNRAKQKRRRGRQSSKD